MNWLLLVLVLLLTPSVAWANARQFDWIPWLIGVTITSSIFGWIWAKRTKMFDNIHLRIVGFSVYFWILAFGQIGVLMVIYALLK
ncbi:MAG: hypothetical protein ACK4E7_16495 [Permianibacter sp.]